MQLTFLFLLPKEERPSNILKELLPKLTCSSGSKWHKAWSAVHLKGHHLDSSWRKDSGASHQQTTSSCQQVSLHWICLHCRVTSPKGMPIQGLISAGT